MMKVGYGLKTKGVQMIKKPKNYKGLRLIGISFNERWNIVEMASKEELERFIFLWQERKTTLGGGFDWDKRRAVIPLSAEMNNLRKTWRLRYGLQFKKEQLYRFDRQIAMYEVKLSPKQGNGQFATWTVRQDLPLGYKPVQKNTILHYSHSDEVGNHYFYNLEHVDSPYLITFKRDDRHLASIVPME